jgi:hypothetical protein
MNYEVGKSTIRGYEKNMIGKRTVRGEVPKAGAIGKQFIIFFKDR